MCVCPCVCPEVFVVVVGVCDHVLGQVQVSWGDSIPRGVRNAVLGVIAK